MKAPKSPRRASLFVLVPLLLGRAITCEGASERNLAINPDFEDGSPGNAVPGWASWQKLDGAVFRLIRDPAVAHTGAQYISIQQTKSDQLNYAVWLQEIPALPRTTYRYSFWLKTDGVRPLTPYNEAWPASCGTVGFLDSKRNALAGYPQSANVFMTHDWHRFEISFTTPDETAFVKINLALGNAVGTIYLDSVSLAADSFHKIESPTWLSDRVAYAAGPWEFASFGDGKALRGILRKLPEIEALGVNLLYLLPLWENSGWYDITDHFALFRKYGTEQDLRALVDEAHRRGMKVILDLAGTIGVPSDARLFRERPEWFVLGPDDKPYRSWRNLYGLDINRPDVRRYFVGFATYYVQRADVDGYRCDMAMALPYSMFEEIRHAIRQIKPEAILIAEGSDPILHETAFDVTYDFPFLDRTLSLISNPQLAGAAVRWLEAERSFYPEGALHLRYFEGHDLDSTVSSRYGLAGSRAFAALLLTLDGIPMIYNGQEVGNREPQTGWWKPPIDWTGNPEALQYRQLYASLIDIRARYPALRRGSLTAVRGSDERVAAFCRALPGEQTILSVINLSDAALETRLDLSWNALGVSGSITLSDLLDAARFTVPSAGSFTLKMSPFQSRVFLVLPEGGTK